MDAKWLIISGSFLPFPQPGYSGVQVIGPRWGIGGVVIFVDFFYPWPRPELRLNGKLETQWAMDGVDQDKPRMLFCAKYGQLRNSHKRVLRSVHKAQLAQFSQSTIHRGGKKGLLLESFLGLVLGVKPLNSKLRIPTTKAPFDVHLLFFMDMSVFLKRCFGSHTATTENLRSDGADLGDD